MECLAYRLGKSERIDSRKLINRLFAGGSSKSLSAYPLRVVYLVDQQSEGQMPASMMVSVSKRHFKHAVDRNRVKRQVREAYRKTKMTIVGSVPEGMAVAMAFIWMSDEHEASETVDAKMENLLQRVAERIKTKEGADDHL